VVIHNSAITARYIRAVRLAVRNEGFEFWAAPFPGVIPAGRTVLHRFRHTWTEPTLTQLPPPEPELPTEPELPEPVPEVPPALPGPPVPEVPLLPEPEPPDSPEPLPATGPLLPVPAGTDPELDPPSDPELVREPGRPALEPEPDPGPEPAPGSELAPEPLDRLVPPEDPEPDAALTVPPGLTRPVPADPVEAAVAGPVPPVPVSEPSWLVPAASPAEPPREPAGPYARADGRKPAATPSAGDRTPAIPLDGAVPPPARTEDDEGSGTRPLAAGVRWSDDFGDGTTWMDTVAIRTKTTAAVERSKIGRLLPAG